MVESAHFLKNNFVNELTYKVEANEPAAMPADLKPIKDSPKLATKGAVMHPIPAKAPYLNIVLNL